MLNDDKGKAGIRNDIVEKLVNSLESSGGGSDTNDIIAAGRSSSWRFIQLHRSDEWIFIARRMQKLNLFI
jgi:hypothetical protein